ncbi:MAG: hypothetical protein RI993_2090 [Pseudomonadota bacterium]
MKSECSIFVALKKRIYFFFFVTGLFFSNSVYSGEVQKWIIKGIEPNSITIIGEHHKRPESIQFFQSVISKYLQQDKCLVVALEIASNQQMILDEIVEGKSTVSDIKISSIIDHTAFRVMINDLAKMAKVNDCLKLIAIDAGMEIDVRRDEWMTKILAEQVSQVPILALLGNMHSLRKVDWNFKKTAPYVAEILASLNHTIRTYPQIWVDKTCGNQSEFIRSDRKKAVEIINNNLTSLLNAYEYKTVSDVVDGIILWKCS